MMTRREGRGQATENMAIGRRFDISAGLANRRVATGQTGCPCGASARRLLARLQDGFATALSALAPSIVIAVGVVATTPSAPAVAQSAANAAPAPAGPSAAASLSEERLRAVLDEAWQDATATWHRVLGRRRYESDLPRIDFVANIRPSHCYGLYVGTGPVYCSGNNTVFVSLAAMHKLALRIGRDDHKGLAILVAHELGHHVQKVTGRFRVFSAMVQAEPRMVRDLSVKFELEADCLAGVWAKQSGGFGARVDVLSEMRQSLAAIGDDRIQLAERGTVNPGDFTHGTSDQRTHWFNAGYRTGEQATCALLESDDY